MFDQEPPEGLKFANGKIYVNTKDPSAYQRLHQAAVERFLEENGEGVDQCLTNILNEQQDGVDKLFPHLSQQITGDGSHPGDDSNATANTSGQFAHSILVPKQQSSEEPGVASMDFGH